MKITIWASVAGGETLAALWSVLMSERWLGCGPRFRPKKIDLTFPVVLVLFFSHDEHHEQKPLGKERIYFILQPIMTGSEGRNSRQKARGRKEAEATEECCLLASSIFIF